MNLSDGVGTRVRLKISDDEVKTALRCRLAIRKHLKGLADARRVAKIDLQFAALGVLGRRHGGKLMGENSHVDSWGGANEP